MYLKTDNNTQRDESIYQAHSYTQTTTIYIYTIYIFPNTNTRDQKYKDNDTNQPFPHCNFVWSPVNQNLTDSKEILGPNDFFLNSCLVCLVLKKMIRPTVLDLHATNKCTRQAHVVTDGEPVRVFLFPNRTPYHSASRAAATTLLMLRVQ